MVIILVHLNWSCDNWFQDSLQVRGTITFSFYTVVFAACCILFYILFIITVTFTDPICVTDAYTAVKKADKSCKVRLRGSNLNLVSSYLMQQGRKRLFCACYSNITWRKLLCAYLNCWKTLTWGFTQRLLGDCMGAKYFLLVWLYCGFVSVFPTD